MNLNELVQRRYTDRFKRTQETIINGLPTFEEYRYSIGYLRGMWDLMEDIHPLLKDPDSAGDEE
jgi:hypothetical protein